MRGLSCSMTDFVFSRGRKKQRNDSRRKSLFRTPTKLRDEDEQDYGAETGALGTFAVGEKRAAAYTSDATAKKQCHDASASSAQAQGVQLHKLITGIVDASLQSMPVKPGQGFALDAANRIAQAFAQEMEQLIFVRNFSDRLPTASERALQKQVASVAETLAALTREEEEWNRIAAEAEKTPEVPQDDGIDAAAVTDSAESLVGRLPGTLSTAVQRITLQVGTLQRALQHARTVADSASRKHQEATKKIHAQAFGSASKDAKPLLRKLMEVGAARDKENLG